MRIFRLLVISVLLTVILLTGTHVLLWLSSRAGDGSFFNTHLRESFSAQPLLRVIFGLHFDGDAKADYLGKRFANISIEVDSVDGSEINKSTLEAFANEVSDISGKPVKLLFSDTIPDDHALTPEGLNGLIDFYRNKKNSISANIYVLVANQLKDDSTTVGTTNREDNIVLFTGALKKFTKDAPYTFDNYARSTLLHEFGHQLGLAHNSIPGCLMGLHVESDHIAKLYPDEVIIHFCPEELEQIKKFMPKR